MNKKVTIINLIKNEINYDLFNEVFEKINFKNPNIPTGNSMQIDEWEEHYKNYSAKFKINKNQIILIFEYLEHFHNKCIELCQPKINKIYRAKNQAEIYAMKINFENEKDLFEILELNKNKQE